MSDESKTPGILGLAARLRRETPVEPSRTIPDPEVSGFDDAFDESDEPAPRVPLRELLLARAARAELLLFRVGGDLFATDLLAVEEALELGEIHPVPGAPPALLGVIAVRGRLLPVYSPERALAHAVSRTREGAYVLVLRASAEGGRPVAMIVDELEDVYAADLGEVRDLVAADAEGAERAGRAVARGAERVVLGVLHWNGELVALVDADALVAACAAPGAGARDAAGGEIG